MTQGSQDIGADTTVHSVLGTYDTHAEAESAVKALQQAGVDMNQLSIIGRAFQTEEHPLGFYTAGDRIKVWGGQGAVWGTLWGMLFGSGFFLIPAIGPVMVMGPLLAWIVSALEGAALGGSVGALAAALTGIGIPKDSVIKYELDVKAGKFLILAHAPRAVIEAARGILQSAGKSERSAPTTNVLETVMKDAKKNEYVSQESILMLLSDDETSRVSTAETAVTLADGDEYLDLEKLDKGVQKAHGTLKAMGRVLPRKAVHADTWKKVQAHLAEHHTAGAHSGVK